MNWKNDIPEYRTDWLSYDRWITCVRAVFEKNGAALPVRDRVSNKPFTDVELFVMEAYYARWAPIEVWWEYKMSL